MIDRFSGTHPHFSILQSDSYWLRPLVMFGVLLVSVILTNTGTRLQLLLIAAIVATGVTLLLIRHPALGSLLLVGSSAVSYSGPSNFNLTMVVAAGLVGLWLFEIVVRWQAIRIVKSITILPLIALVAAASVGFAVGQLSWYSFAPHAPLGAQLGGLSLYYLSAGVFLVTAHRIKRLSWLKWTVWLFLALGTLVTLGRVLPNVFGRLAEQLISIQALGSLFWVWLLTLSVSQAVFNVELRIRWRIGLGTLAALVLYVTIVQLWEWNSGWTPALASIGAMMIIAQPKLGMLGVLAGIVFAATKYEKILTMIMVGDNQYSYDTRLEAWEIVWEIAKVNPILGLGPSNYYWYTPLFPIRGWAVSFNSHQQYVDLIAQTGLIGLVCFVWFFATVGWVAFRLRNRVNPGFERAYVYAALGGTVGTLVSAAFGDWVIPFFYNITMGGFRASMLSWLFLGGLIALTQILGTQKDESRKSTMTRLSENSVDHNST